MSDKYRVENFVKEKHEQGIEELFKSVSAKYPNGIYWYHGNTEEEWRNVFVCLDGACVVGKSQVMLFEVQDEDSPETAEHQIYIHLRVLPEYENNYEVYDLLYRSVYERSLVLKQSLPCKRPCQLNVGNMEQEEVYNHYFMGKGYKPHYDRYHMSAPTKVKFDYVSELEQHNDIKFRIMPLDTIEEKKRFLELENCCFAGDEAMSMKKLEDLMDSDWFMAIAAEKAGRLIGVVLAERDGDDPVMIDDVMVREEYRGRHIARILLQKLLTEAEKSGIEKAQLLMSPSNTPALKTYIAAGFAVDSLERRYTLYI